MAATVSAASVLDVQHGLLASMCAPLFGRISM
jgi:hypothetical protein